MLTIHLILKPHYLSARCVTKSIQVIAKRSSTETLTKNKYAPHATKHRTSSYGNVHVGPSGRDAIPIDIAPPSWKRFATYNQQMVNRTRLRHPPRNEKLPMASLLMMKSSLKMSDWEPRKNVVQVKLPSGIGSTLLVTPISLDMAQSWQSGSATEVVELISSCMYLPLSYLTWCSLSGDLSGARKKAHFLYNQLVLNKKVGLEGLIG